MPLSDNALKLLKGAVDLHVHSGPGLIPRSLDHVQAARDAVKVGMRALVVKDQHSMTCHSIYFIRKYILKDDPIDIWGGMVLNNATGGLSPHTVDAAIKSGAKIIWMPTASAANHIEVHKKMTTSFPHTKEKMIDEIPLTILDKEGRLLPQIPQILSLIAKADVILGTGHLSIKEVKLLIDEARKQGVKKILMQHPEFLINATIEDMIEIADKGVMIEHSVALFVKGSVEKPYLVEMIRKVGAERTSLGSDLGQVGNPPPIEGLGMIIDYLLESGITEEEIDLMLRKNPARLIGLQ